MEKVTKKYKCSIYKGGVWWSANSIDKPSKNLFINNYKNKMVEIDITPNWIDQFTVNLVLDNPGYGLLKIEDLTLNKTFYFINSNINKTLTNGYLVTYDLDLYLTYGLTFFEEISNQGFNMVKVNRMLNPLLFRKYSNTSQMQEKYFNSNYYYPCEKYMYQVDPVIDYSKYSVTSYMKPVNLQLTQIVVPGNLSGSGFPTTPLYKWTDTNNQFNGNCVFYFGAGNKLAKPVVHIFELSNGLYCCFLQPYNYNWGGLQMPNWVPQAAKNALKQGQHLDDSGNFRLKTIDNFPNTIQSKITWLANKYIGCFEIPFIEYITDWYLWGGGFSKQATPPDGVGDYYASAWTTYGEVVLCFTLQRNQVKGLSNPKTIINNRANIGGCNYVTKPTTWFSLKPNSEESNNFLIHFANPYNFSFLSWPNSGYMPLDFYSNAYFTFDGNNFNIIQNATTNYSTSTDFISRYHNNLNGGNGINTMRGTFNISVDSYNEYINSVKSTQNTNLEIARQNLKYSGAVSMLNFAMGGELTGVNMINQGFQQIGNFMKYHNMEKSYAAQNMAAKNTSQANNISSSVTSDDIYNKTNLFSIKDITTLYVNFAIQYPQSAPEQLEVLYYILQYGIYINDYLPCDLFFSFFTNENLFINDFVYIDFEISDKLLKMVFPTENQELINALKILCTNSFRIWKIDDIKFSEDKQYHVF